MKQTAVEWLVDWMGKNQYFIGNDLLEAFEQAKAMEKEQINKAYYDGYYNDLSDWDVTLMDGLEDEPYNED